MEWLTAPSTERNLTSTWAIRCSSEITEKSAKFDPIFLHQPFKIIDVNEAGNKIIVEQEQEESGFTLCRHSDDIKPFKRYQKKIRGTGRQ